MKTRLFLIVVTFLLFSHQGTAQSSKRLLKTFVPYQWEIYNTIYKRRYWDWRDNYDYITFEENKTFKRKYEGINTSGTWKYIRKNKQIILMITEPSTKRVILKIEKLSRNELSYTSSEEGHKVTMFLKEGEVPVEKTRKQSSKRLPKPEKKTN